MRMQERANLKAAHDKVGLMARNTASKARLKKARDAAKVALAAAQAKKSITALNNAAKVKARIKENALQAVKARTKVS